MSGVRKRAEEALASSLVTLSNKPRYADLPMLSLIAWVGRTARAAIAAEEEGRGKEKGNGQR